MTNERTRSVGFYMLCRPFSNEPRRKYKILVDPDGSVKVWDDIAKHYTSCHILTSRSMAAARRKAKALFLLWQ